MKTCFLDCDGILTDFVAGALAVHGKKLPRNSVKWDFCSQIGFNGPNDPAFWAPMGHDFWANLGFTAEAKEVLSIVERFFGDNVALLTSPCDTPGAVEGKVTWIRNHLPQYRRRFFVGPPKHPMAAPDKFLIDDNDDNCRMFVEHGGAVWKAPRPWNTLFFNCDGDGNFNPAVLYGYIEDTYNS